MYGIAQLLPAVCHTEPGCVSFICTYAQVADKAEGSDDTASSRKHMLSVAPQILALHLNIYYTTLQQFGSLGMTPELCGWPQRLSCRRARLDGFVPRIVAQVEEGR